MAPRPPGLCEVMDGGMLSGGVINEGDVQRAKARPRRPNPAELHAGHRHAISKREEVDGMLHPERSSRIVLRWMGLRPFGQAVAHDGADVGPFPTVLHEVFPYAERDWRQRPGRRQHGQLGEDGAVVYL